ncbi:CMRF35-like molecule 1 [Astyanax mexicanus]|uniref:CMRF35-like molecule 1 n=1 Tax=Astyanax mexicanus TaxID=7994 RepID=A0A8T2KVT4_ASTMX|nr:CMRF35-like molecule 1 [Astyanax mexicanus]
MLVFTSHSSLERELRLYSRRFECTELAMREMLMWVILGAISYETSGISVRGHEGETISITCSHSWAGSNRKYFCRDPCSDRVNDALVDSEKKSNGRYQLTDYGTGVFTVEITGITKEDSGKYWCGVKRVWPDTFNEVFLTVLDALQTSPPPTSSTQCPTSVPVTSLLNISTSNSSNSTVSDPATTDQSNNLTTTDWRTYLIVFGCVLLLISVVWILVFTGCHCRACACPPCCSRRRQFDVADYEEKAKQNSRSQRHPTETTDSEPTYENVIISTSQPQPEENIYCNQ